jgi:hypothetical protein
LDVAEGEIVRQRCRNTIECAGHEVNVVQWTK